MNSNGRSSEDDIDRSRNNSIDVKYELFLEWLQMNAMFVDDAEVMPTDDERTSQVLTSDDEDDFVDTEAEYPLIALTEDEPSSTTSSPTNGFYASLMMTDRSIDLCRDQNTPTPTLLDVHPMVDYDSSTSDLSGVSDNTKMAKRRARHNKGKAPAIPVQVEQMDEVDAPMAEEKSDKKTILNFFPGLFRSKSPVAETSTPI